MALSDLEELIGTIGSQPMRSYMREAMSCYSVGAYRGCIVLSYIALFDDLLDKLGALGSVNAAAKTIFTEASKKKGNQDVYESYLIDQLTTAKLVSGLDNAFLTTLRTLRNKSAHPSGHTPSAEEARFIFREVVARFLSRPILSTTQLIDEIVDRLGNANIFPSPAVKDISSVVENEVATLHEEAFTQLVVKLTAATSSTEKTVRKNARYFLVGLSQIKVPAALKALQSKLVEAKCDDQTFARPILSAISANGALVIGVHAVSKARIQTMLITQLEEASTSVTDAHLSDPVSALASLARSLDDAQLTSDFKAALLAIGDHTRQP